MNNYDHKKIESKWQKRWKEEKLYRTEECKKKKKFYVLDMFPYPSGAGLHVGHPKGYIATDIIARMKTMQGYNVLHPMGWDAFGLPAENYAIKNKIHPRAAVEENIKKFKKQLEKIGFTYDWDREINTTDSEYYRWTQWIFLKMFENGLAYQSYEPINWCPGCQTGLANEDLENGKCERCGSEVEKRPMRQWVLKMTAYADRLLDDLKLLDWDESIIEQQRNWIGRSEGVSIKFQIKNSKSQINPKSKIPNSKHFLEVFTTRPDTLFGCTYMVICPEHEIIKNLESGILNLEEVRKYVEKVRNKSDLERTDLAKEKTGVELKGIKAINPVNNEEVPIWVADYVLAGYGTGAIMAVPAHDERDWEFANKFGLPIKFVVEPKNNKTKTPERNSEDFGEPEDSHPWRKTQTCHFITSVSDNKNVVKGKNSVKPAEGLKPSDLKMTSLGPHHTAGSSTPDSLYQNNKTIVKKEVYARDGVNINSDFLNGLETEEAKKKMIEWLEENNFGRKAVNYKMRDWVFSRQRYWGEPIPLVFCENCKKLVENNKSKITNPKQIQNSKFKIQNYEFSLGEILNPGWVADKRLPLELPEVKHYEPTGTGESPLANIKEWVNTTCPKCGGPAKRETNTMPQWAGSCWYYLRYLDPKNSKELVDKEKDKYWMKPNGVDLYVGGAEHATRHLLYARFWHKFLYDLKVVSTSEPFHKLYYVGLILAEDGRKMSKRWGNVINPDEIVEKYGADSLRLYEMFMGPFSQATTWNTNGSMGIRRFLEKIWGLFKKSKIKNQKHKSKVKDNSSLKVEDKLERLLHKTIKKVTEDIEDFKFNTAVSQLMILTNEMDKQEKIPIINYQLLIILLSPFAPHIAEELWEKLGNKESIYLQPWPKYDPKLIKEEEIEMIVQINGKLRDRIKASVDVTEEEARKLVLESEKIKKWVEGKEIKKFIFVRGKLVNIVV